MNEKKRKIVTLLYISALGHLAINWVCRIPHQLCLEKERKCKCQHKNILDILGTAPFQWSETADLEKTKWLLFHNFVCAIQVFSFGNAQDITNINWLGFYCSNIINLFWCTMTRLCLLLPNSKCMSYMYVAQFQKTRTLLNTLKLLLRSIASKVFLKMQCQCGQHDN